MRLSDMEHRTRLFDTRSSARPTRRQRQVVMSMVSVGVAVDYVNRLGLLEGCIFTHTKQTWNGFVGVPVEGANGRDENRIALGRLPMSGTNAGSRYKY